ncbi:polyphenol oxidase family protein [Psychrobacter namhaensis]|uniref:polyphenol oxidase family protein n=1 Tax=Psychrobacter namhaensis TaxID=292734 RepID=UPI003FD6B992
MINKLPMTLLTQIDDVAVFQTAAFTNAETVSASDFDLKNQQLEPHNGANYGELNLGLHVSDEATKVLGNRMRLLAAINEQFLTLSSQRFQDIPIKRLHWVNQIHGKQIHDVDATALSMQPVAADAMVSQQTGLGLAIMTADCVPIVLYQPTSGQIAAIHAGWQGLAAGIIPATVKRFKESGEIKAWIGVCISQDNYEVGVQVRDQLLKGCIENTSLTKASIDSFDQRYAIHSDDVSKNGSKAPHLPETVDKATIHATSAAKKIKLNLPKLAADQLSSAGVRLAHETLIHCSYADDRYYSYRRQTHLQQPATGRMALVIARAASV